MIPEMSFCSVGAGVVVAGAAGVLGAVAGAGLGVDTGADDPPPSPPEVGALMVAVASSMVVLLDGA